MSRWSLASLPHGLLQPVRHAHLAVHRRRGGEVLLRLLALARALVELAEPEMAVGDEGSHAEFGSERQGVGSVLLCTLVMPLNGMNVSQQAEGVGFLTSLGVCPRQLQSMFASLQRVIISSPPQKCVGQVVHVLWALGCP